MTVFRPVIEKPDTTAWPTGGPCTLEDARNKGLDQSALQLQICARFADGILSALRSHGTSDLYALHVDDVTPSLPPAYATDEALSPLPPDVQAQGYRFALGLQVSSGSAAQSEQLLVAHVVIRVEPALDLNSNRRLLNLSWEIATLRFRQQQVIAPIPDWFVGFNAEVVKAQPEMETPATQSPDLLANLRLALDDRSKALFDRCFGASQCIPQGIKDKIKAVGADIAPTGDADDPTLEQFIAVLDSSFTAFLRNFSDDVWGATRDLHLVNIDLAEMPATAAEARLIVKILSEQIQRLFADLGARVPDSGDDRSADCLAPWVAEALKKKGAGPVEVVEKLLEASRLGLTSIFLRETRRGSADCRNKDRRESLRTGNSFVRHGRMR
jgi:hypothetical protein